MVTLILGHGRAMKDIRCMPISAKDMNIDFKEVIMIDNDSNMHPDILYDLNSGQTLPFDDNSVDLVVDTSGLGGVSEWFRKPCFWKEMLRIMKHAAEFHGADRNKALRMFPYGSGFNSSLKELKLSHGTITAFILTKKDES